MWCLGNFFYDNVHVYYDKIQKIYKFDPQNVPVLFENSDNRSNVTGKEGKDGKVRKSRSSNPIASKPSSAAAVAAVAMPHHRIPRPPNAFMIFANEHRKILAKKHPRESNKEISIRLGKMWRSLGDDIKGKYHAQAKILDLEHKKKYPDYVYNPRDARLRKEARRQRLIAGQHLARAMSHHIMVKQAKNNMLNLAPQRMPVPVPCMQKNNQDIHEQMNNARRAAIRDQVLRGLGLETPGDKRAMGYLIAPNSQQQNIPGFQTFMTSPPMPVHLMPPRHPPPTATITSSANFGANQNIPPNSGPFASTSTVTACQTMASASQVSTFASRDQLSSAVSKYMGEGGDRPHEAVTVQFVHPTSQESIPKNPLLTLADEAVSKLSETNTEVKVVTVEGEGNGEVHLEETEENNLIAQENTNAIQMQIEEGDENNNKNEFGDQAEQKIPISQQNMFDIFGTREKMMQKAPLMTAWLTKPETPVRINRPLPLYFVHPPTPPPMMTVRPPVAACIQYTSNSNQAFQTNSSGGTTIQRIPESQSTLAGSPRSGISLQHALWDNNADSSLMPNSSVFSGSSTIPSFSNTYGNPIMPWTGSHVFYVPMQELAYAPPYPYTSAYPGGYQQCFSKRESTVTKATDADQLSVPNLTFTVADENPIDEDINSNGKNFGQILSSTMQILTEEQVEQDGKTLDPTCHVNYELVEKDSSPNRHLADLTNAQAASQYSTVFY